MTLNYQTGQTALTLQGIRSYVNRKPYRTKMLKALAKSKAYRTKAGNYSADVETYLHGEACEAHCCRCPV